MYDSMTDEQAIEYAKKSISSLKGVTRAAWEHVIRIAENHIKSETRKLEVARNFSAVMDDVV